MRSIKPAFRPEPEALTGVWAQAQQQNKLPIKMYSQQHRDRRISASPMPDLPIPTQDSLGAAAPSHRRSAAGAQQNPGK